jgi:hypothetical protein
MKRIRLIALLPLLVLGCAADPLDPDASLSMDAAGAERVASVERASALPNVVEGTWYTGTATRYGPNRLGGNAYCDATPVEQSSCYAAKLTGWESTWYTAIADLAPRAWGPRTNSNGESTICRSNPWGGEPICDKQPNCGLCYEVRCVSKYDASAPADTSDNELCASGASVVVKATDACPHNHSNPTNAKWCSGKTDHFDLGCDAFQAIAAHQVGQIHMQWRLVSCSVGLGVKANGLPRDTSWDCSAANRDRLPPPESPGDAVAACADQKRWKKCDEPWMLKRGGYCNATCGRCPGGPVDEEYYCDAERADRRHPDALKFTCADQKKWGKCDLDWMLEAGGYCNKTCGRCDPPSGSGGTSGTGGSTTGSGGSATGGRPGNTGGTATETGGQPSGGTDAPLPGEPGGPGEPGIPGEPGGPGEPGVTPGVPVIPGQPGDPAAPPAAPGSAEGGGSSCAVQPARTTSGALSWALLLAAFALLRVRHDRRHAS